MKHLDLRIMRDRLVARRHALLARYDHARELVDEELGSPEIELADLASEQWDARVLSVASERDRHSLERVCAALQRIDRGEFGRCERCGERIDPRRLAALPEAERCLSCAGWR